MLTRERQRVLNEEYEDMCKNYPSKGCVKVDTKGKATDCPFNKTGGCKKAFFYEKGGQDAVINYSVSVLADVVECAKQEDAPIYEGDKKVDQWIRLSDVEEAINKYLN